MFVYFRVSMELTDLDGVGPVTAKKLNDAGITNVMQLTNRGIPDLMEITGSDKATAKMLFAKAVKALREAHEVRPRFEKATQVEEQRKNVEFIKTGTKALDFLFGNGIETEATTEVYGEFGCGKTQFCHTMAVMVQKLKEDGGLATPDNKVKVLWIDSEGTFRPERIRDICKYHNMDANEVLDNIYHSKVLNSADQQMSLEEAESLFKTENIRLVIVDSAIGLFRNDYIGRGTLSERQGVINEFTTLCSRFAERYKIAFILTNQVMQDPNGGFGDPTRPIGGSVLAHATTYRVYFKKAGKKRIVRIIDSPHHDSETEVIIGINERGVVDPEVQEADAVEAKKQATKAKRQATLDAKKSKKEEEEE